MTYKQIEASREARLWLGQIIVPAVTLLATTIIAVPEAREAVATKCKDITNSLKKKFHKEKV